MSRYETKVTKKCKNIFSQKEDQVNLSQYGNCVNSGIRGQPPVRSHDKHDERMTLKGVEEGKRY